MYHKLKASEWDMNMHIQHLNKYKDQNLFNGKKSGKFVHTKSRYMEYVSSR